MFKTIFIFGVLFFSSPTISAENIRIAAASSFRPALQKLVPVFEKQHNIKVTYRATSSGGLYNHILNGAPYDLFLSADSDFPKRLVKAGIADETTRTTYALGILAWWQPGSEMVTLAQPIHFKQPVALAKAKLAPYGKAAVEVIHHLQQIGFSFSKKVYGSNISQAYQFIDSGNAVGGFVAYSYLISAGVQNSYWIIPSNWYQPIEQQAIVISNENSCISKLFLAFLQSPEARKIITETGYSLPDSINIVSKSLSKECNS